MDVLFINPGNAFGIYQDLSKSYTAVEPPVWSVLLAGSCISLGYKASIIDANAESLTDKEVVERIKKLNPRLICIPLFGANVNAGVVGMNPATRLSNYIKVSGVEIPISYVGNYVQALPRKALEDEPSIDFVFANEGVLALKNILATNIDLNNLDSIKGIVWRKNGKIIFNPPEQVAADLDKDLPFYAWDLLPYKEKPFDLYRSPLWHAEYQEGNRSPYVAIQTSLGCPMKCSFCLINTINRNDNAEIGVASNYSKIRYWSPEHIIKEFDKLYAMGVRTIKVTDELFLLNKNYYVPLCQMLKEKGYGKDLRLWVYSRVDTVANPETLTLLKEAGVKYIALGIESSSRTVRLEVTKGKFQDVDIKKVVDQIHDAGIEVMANYIFGLPSDTMESMRETQELAKTLCTSGYNAYSAINLPGSQLYYDAIKKGIELPKTYLGYSFHSYETVCNSTDTLTAGQILKFRDDAYIEYHTYPPFLARIERLYGKTAADNIREMTKIKLKRKLVDG